MDFLINKLTSDLDFGDNNSAGLQLTPDFKTEIEQRLIQAWSLNLTEWFADITAGLPWIRNKDEDLATNLRYFLGDKSPNAPQFIANYLDKYTLELPFVDSIKSSYEFNPATREFVWTASVVASGEDIRFPPVTLTI